MHGMVFVSGVRTLANHCSGINQWFGNDGGTNDSSQLNGFQGAQLVASDQPTNPHARIMFRVDRTTLSVVFFTSPHTSSFPASGQAVVTGAIPSPPGSCLQFLSRIYRVQRSHCSSIFHRASLTHALARSASQFVHKKKVPTNSYEYALGVGFFYFLETPTAESAS